MCLSQITQTDNFPEKVIGYKIFYKIDTDLLLPPEKSNFRLTSTWPFLHFYGYESMHQLNPHGKLYYKNIVYTSSDTIIYSDEFSISAVGDEKSMSIKRYKSGFHAYQNIDEAYTKFGDNPRFKTIICEVELTNIVAIGNELVSLNSQKRVGVVVAKNMRIIKELPLKNKSKKQ